MKSLLIDYAKIFYWGWVILFFMHMGYNSSVYTKMKHEDFELLTPKWWRTRRSTGTATTLAIFTFWWGNYKTEEDLELRRLMKLSNKMNIIFILYSIAVFILFLYVYDQVPVRK